MNSNHVVLVGWVTPASRLNAARWTHPTTYASGLRQFHGTKSSGLDIMRALVHVGECE
jgi:hypothetical protein